MEVLLVVLISVILIFGLFYALTFFYTKTKYYKKQVERSLKMVPFLVRLPRESGQDKLEGNRDQRDVAQELISSAESMYNTLFSIYKGGWKKKIYNFLYRNRHIALEIVAVDKEIYFYIAAPYVLAPIIEKTVTTHYPDARIEEVEEHNIFSKDREMAGVLAAEVYTRKNHHYPLRTYTEMENEPIEAITNALSMLEADEGAAIQFLIRPADPAKMKAVNSTAQKVMKGPDKNGSNFLADFAKDVAKPGSSTEQRSPEAYRATPEEEELSKNISRKSSKYGFDTRINIVIAARDDHRASLILDQIQSAFVQFGSPTMNGLKFKKAGNERKKEAIITNFIFRFFTDTVFGGDKFFADKSGHNPVLSTEELATLYHFPNALIQTPGINWLSTKASVAPVNLPTEGTPFAFTNFRGREEVVRIKPEDRLRHMYVVGQTGTGKTSLLKHLIINDILAGNGVCYIDPHGDDAMNIVNHIPKERAEDVIIFDPADTERPMALNIFEAGTTEEKDFVIQEAIQMLYRLYDPGHTGIMGPRFEHWFRNAALLLMSDPAGGTFIDIPRVFTDDAFMAEKLKFVQDPVVRNFFINEMGQTSEYHKSEMLGWFVGKFGAFMTNTTMRNILGQTVSSFNFSEIMDNKKILIVRLSKGVIGEMNMQLLGMIFISKLQMAAMRRASAGATERVPFYMYIDEFQNFATDNIAQIFSEARKFKLSLTVANQYISQMREDIRDSVFGNVGTIASFRVSSEDGEYLQKQYEPEFGAHDLVNQENLNGIIKLIIDGVPTRPFNYLIKFPLPGEENKEIGKAIIELSRLKNARPRDIVDAEVLSKMNIGQAAPLPTGGVPRDGVG
jgi:hypothetical protein